MYTHSIQSLMRTYHIKPECITYLLQQGIEIERIKCQTAEVLDKSNHEEMIRLLQGERFLCILSASRLT
jgi:hypothetical protein